MFKKGDSVTINGDHGLVVMDGKEIPGDAEDQLGVFFGTFEDGRPEVWIIPSEYLREGPPVLLKH